jgi:hypothetical protein
VTEHPYWIVATVATSLIALSIVGFMICLIGLARTQWRHARQRLAWDLDQHAPINEDFEAEHRQLLADHHDTDG